MYSTAQCISKSYKKSHGVSTGCITLAVLGSMQPEHKMPKITGTLLNHIKLHADNIFVLPNLGTDQSMSTTLGYQKTFRNFA